MSKKNTLITEKEFDSLKQLSGLLPLKKVGELTSRSTTTIMRIKSSSSFVEYRKMLRKQQEDFKARHQVKVVSSNGIHAKDINVLKTDSQELFERLDKIIALLMSLSAIFSLEGAKKEEVKKRKFPFMS